MHKILLVGFLCASSAVHAETYNVNAEVININPVYNRVTYSDPVNSCHDVSVPVYQNTGQSNPINTLFGAIFGGAIANHLGGGSGKDAMTVLGAIMGAEVAQNNSRTVSGYQKSQRCRTKYVRRVENVVRGYNVTYSWNGLTGVAYTKHKPRMGAHMPVKITLN
tara:strand:- start:15644 stop:16135 length:492 start_codon:yes stop_codon:yes gene_type:complete